MSGVLQVCLVEDDRRYRESLRLMLTASPGFSVRAAFGDAEQALVAARSKPDWDLVIMDLDLPGIDGVEATRRLRDHLPEVAVVVLTAFDDPPRILAAIRSGADGYLLKSVDGDELVEYLTLAAQGGAPMTPGVARSVLELLRGNTPQREPCPTLSPRERDVLEALVRGMAYKEVADELGISIETVRGYVRTLYKKLRVHSATEAVSKALRQGWVE
jgi:DNA-binding NarL/FixJ family response regulator